MVKGMSFSMTEELHFKFKNKCHFYDLKMNEVLTKLIALFAKTDELDEMFNIRKD